MEMRARQKLDSAHLAMNLVRRLAGSCMRPINSTIISITSAISRVSRSGMNALEINELKSIPLYFAFSRWKTGGESFFF